MAKKADPERSMVAQNRRARRDYELVERVEAGIVLAGSEVKSLRAGHASLQEAWAGERGGEIWLINSYIAEYPSARHFNHEPNRPRKLLLHKRERDKMLSAVQRGGMTLVPLALYFNDRGIAKIDLALGRGRSKIDKREVVKQRDWNRQKARLLRENR